MNTRFDLSRRHYWADLASAPLAVVALAAVASGGGSLLIVPGFALWTFIEYAVHRWVFHGRGRLAASHAEHHRHPIEFLGASPLAMPSIAMLAATSAALLWPPAAMLAAGLVLGYLTYFLAHSAMHHTMLRPSHPLYRATLRHARHHAGGERSDFGIVFPFWDRLFGTAGAACA